MILMVNNPGHVRRILLAQELKLPYVTADKTLMVAAEIKAVTQNSYMETSVNVCQRRVFTKAMSFICRYLWQGRR
jgi:hypothetical protein